MALFAALSLVVLLAPASNADPGPNYTQQFATDWETAGDGHSIYVEFQPETPFWKFEVRTRCQTGDFYWNAWEYVDYDLWRGRFDGNNWEWWSGQTVYDDAVQHNHQVHDNTFPGGDGVRGWYSGNYQNNGIFTIQLETRPGYHGHVNGDLPCEFKFALQKHV